MKTIQQVNIKDKHNFSFNDMTNIKNVDLSLLDIDLVTFKSSSVSIYDIKYIKDLNCSDSLYLVFNNLEAYVEESNANKYLVFISTNNNGNLVEKYTEVWNEIREHIK